jgi:hypothetical protein
MTERETVRRPTGRRGALPADWVSGRRLLRLRPPGGKLCTAHRYRDPVPDAVRESPDVLSRASRNSPVRFGSTRMWPDPSTTS